MRDALRNAATATEIEPGPHRFCRASPSLIARPIPSCPQVLEDIALTIQNQLQAKLPFCAFNGGNDVFGGWPRLAQQRCTAQHQSAVPVHTL